MVAAPTPTGRADRSFPPLTLMGWLRFDGIRRQVREAGPTSVLEVGCGQGAIGRWLASGRRYVGVELDEPSRLVAASRLVGASDATVVADLDAVGGEQFDVVAAFEVIEHIEDDAAALDAWRQRLRPGGRILLSVPAHPQRFGASDALVGHYRRYSRTALDELAAAASLRIVHLEPYGAGLGHVLDRVQDRLAARRSATEVADVGTTASGRFRQPGSRPAALARAGCALPFRAVQPVWRHTDVGVGYVLALEPIAASGTGSDG